MKDIAPELLERIEKAFQTAFGENRAIQSLNDVLFKGEATFQEAHRFSVILGEMLARAYESIHPEELPDGKMYYNIAKRVVEPTLKAGYELAATYAQTTQTLLNRKGRMRLKGVKAPLPQDKIDGLIEKVSSDVFEKTRWVLGEPVKTFTQSVVDETVKANTIFQYRAGLTPKVVRKEVGNCCDWCKALVGEYEYPHVPQDVFRRHRYCRCTVEYFPGDGKKQNIHTKEWVDIDQDGDPLRRDRRSSAQRSGSLAKIRERIEKIDLRTATVEEIIDLGKEINNHSKIRTIIGDKEALVEAFSKYRDMGGTIEKTTWAKGCNRAVKKQIEDAFSHYPTAWSERVNQSPRQLLTVKSKRGFFAPGAVRPSGRTYNPKYPNYRDGYWTICTETIYESTPYHEIGHLMDWFQPEAVRLEKEFVAKRTAGELPTRLKDIFPGYGYRPHEITLKDDFITPYIGKTYYDGTEVLSIGLESIFEPGIGQDKAMDPITGKIVRKRITDDEEYLNFILGLLMTI